MQYYVPAARLLHIDDGRQDIHILHVAVALAGRMQFFDQIVDAGRHVLLGAQLACQDARHDEFKRHSERRQDYGMPMQFCAIRMDEDASVIIPA